MSVSVEAWEAKGRELFGEDKLKWRFVCPACGHEMSGERVRTDFTEHMEKLRASDYRIESECIGRHLPGVGCNWCAYGLFRGPVLVVDGGKEIAVFDFAGKPFTSKPQSAVR